MKKDNVEISRRIKMIEKKSLSIIVPAYNEEKNIQLAIVEIVRACDFLPASFEIIVVNDCSIDGTKKIVEDLQKKYPMIILVNNEKNLGFGGAVKVGLHAAVMENMIMVGADNCIGWQSLSMIFSKMGEADLVIPYIQNPEERDFSRRFISYVFVLFVNLLFWLNLKYYNGHNILPVQAVRGLKFSGNFAFSVEILVQLIKEGYTWIEVPMTIKERENGESSAFHVRNIIKVCSALLSLFVKMQKKKWLQTKSNSKIFSQKLDR